jgi:hypothetical protein
LRSASSHSTSVTVDTRGTKSSRDDDSTPVQGSGVNFPLCPLSMSFLLFCALTVKFRSPSQRVVFQAHHVRTRYMPSIADHAKLGVVRLSQIDSLCSMPSPSLLTCYLFRIAALVIRLQQLLS